MKKVKTFSYVWDLAVELGSADKASMLSLIDWSIFYKETDEHYDPEHSKYFMDGVWWMQDSLDSWQKRMPWLSSRTIRRYLTELLEGGYIQRKIVALSQGGREATFYRLPTERRSGQNAPQPEVANLSIGSGQIGQFVEVAKLDSSSFTYNQTINPTNNQGSAMPPLTPPPEWQASNPLAPIFEQLTKVPICAKQFNEAKYTGELQALKGELDISDQDLLDNAAAWQKWHNSPGGKKPQKAWMNFEGWVKRSVRWKPKPKAMGGGAAKPSLQDTFENMVSGLKEHNRLKKLSEEQNG